MTPFMTLVIALADVFCQFKQSARRQCIELVNGTTTEFRGLPVTVTDYIKVARRELATLVSKCGTAELETQCRGEFAALLTAELVALDTAFNARAGSVTARQPKARLKSVRKSTSGEKPSAGESDHAESRF